MGFTPEPTVYTLNFDDTPLKGLEIKARCCSMADYNVMLRNSEADNMADLAAKNEQTVDIFLRYLVSWNLTATDGTPVAMTKEGIATQENPFIASIIAAWQTAMVTVPVPLNLQSPNGATSLEESLGLAGESLSPGNWPKQS